MALTNGTKLGPYEIVALLGAGGMGEVYRARDTRLGRDVAIKILPSQLSERPESRQRFEREAHAVSALNHPHICTLHDVGSQDGTKFLVMEYLEGETLAARLEKGALPHDQVLKYGVEIADALDKAHRQAIIHRDLKPGNIMLTKSGAKLLDFGLAKAVDSPHLSDLTLSLTSPAVSKPVTATGTVIGTFQYMSPEQIEGKEADTRSDIFALGTVLYEMATGARAFEGKSQASVMAAVLAAEPKPISVLRPMSPPALDRVVKVCIAKDPDERWQTAHDVKLQLQWIAEGGSQAGVPVPVVSQRKRRERAAWATAALFVLTTIAFAAGFLLRGPRPQLPVRLSAELGADVRLGVPLAGSEVVLWPDGTRLVLLAVGADNVARLYIRSLDQMQATPLSGTEGARNPFFSPDGQWIGFFSARDSFMKKISVQGGAAVTLCKSSNTFGGSWGADGTIVFTEVADRSGIFKVSAAGGTPQPVVLDSNVTRSRRVFPQILPGGKTVLFTSGVAGFPEDAEVVVYSLASGESKTVLRGGFYARYLVSGHLVYMHQGTMFAVPFNLDRLEVTGQAVPVVEGVVTSPNFGGAQFSVSDTGTLVYEAGASMTEGLLLHWFDEQVKSTLLPSFPPGIPANPRISPDGKRLAVDINEGMRRDVFVYDLERDTPARITFSGEQNSGPAWTPDGRQITYASQDRDGSYGLYLIRADGAGDAQRLTQNKAQLLAGSWRPDGKVLAFMQTNPETGNDIMTLTREGSEQSGWKIGEAQPFLNTPANESAPRFSPDGRWLAYQSDESGVMEVYVRPFPGPGGKWQISPDHGTAPRWARNGKELLYRTQGPKIMAVTYTASGGTFHADKPRPWASGQFPGGPPSSWGLEPDGKRIAAVGVPANNPVAQGLNKVSFIFNFFDELRRKVPTRKN